MRPVVLPKMGYWLFPPPLADLVAGMGVATGLGTGGNVHACSHSLASWHGDVGLADQDACEAGGLREKGARRRSQQAAEHDGSLRL